MIFSLAAHAQFFTRVTDAGGIVTDSARSIGASWGDYNNDGYMDMFVAETERPNFLYVNNGNGTFTTITSGPVVTTWGVYNVGIWGDYNNDGYQDLYVTNWATIAPGGNPGDPLPNYLYRNEGPPNYSMSLIDLGNDSTISYSASWVDYDLNGDLDLFCTGDYNTSDLFYHNDGNDTWAKLSAASGGSSESWIDYDDDGDMDLLVINWLSPNELWQNLLNDTGTLHFVQNNTTPLTNEGNVWDLSVSWGDYDNDGDLDAFMPTIQALNRLYRNEGDGNFQQVSGLPMVSVFGNTNSAAWGDYDNDGDLDLFTVDFSISGFQVCALYRNEGNGSFQRMTGAEVGDIATAAATSQAAAWGDYDNDGDLDMYVANFAFPYSNSGTPQPNFFFRNNQGSANHWITLTCVGTTSNRAAVGAKVRAKATINGSSYWQMRVISGGATGTVSQNDPRVHFGLGDATLIDSLKIEWPSGAVEIYTGLSADHFYTATEGQGVVTTIQPERDGQGSVIPEYFRLEQNYPNPFNPRTNLGFGISDFGFVSLSIFDVVGKKIIILVEKELPPGEYEVQWDGRDSAGRKVESGVYFYTLKAGGFQATRKMVLAR